MKSVYELFVDASDRWPARTALVDTSGSLTYQELRAAADRLGATLAAHASPDDRLVGIRVSRDRNCAIGVLGVLAAGRGYVPIDPDYPQDHQTLYEEDSGVRLVITDRQLSSGEHLLDSVDSIQIGARSTHVGRDLPDDVVYVIYTSGSTGRPKGCVVGHGHLAAFIDSWNALYPTEPDDVWTMSHSLSFDFSVAELWLPLTNGGTCDVVPADLARDPVAYIELLARHRVTVLAETPTMFGNLRVGLSLLGRTLPDLRTIFLGGEAIRPHDIIEWIDDRFAPNARLINGYGPTETVVGVAAGPLTEDRLRRCAPGESPIGRPLRHALASVHDAHGDRVDDGTPGELWIAGPSVIHGYLERPDLTRDRFVVVDGVRHYRTGDQVVTHDGTEYHYLGRTDDQVKLRGFRIELGEVESAIASLGGVQAVAAGIETTRQGHRRLVAYVVAQPASDLDADGIRSHLRGRLPEQYHPSRIKRLARLPFTTSGKLDRAALPGAKELGWDQEQGKDQL